MKTLKASTIARSMASKLFYLVSSEYTDVRFEKAKKLSRSIRMINMAYGLNVNDFSYTRMLRNVHSY